MEDCVVVCFFTVCCSKKDTKAGNDYSCKP